MSPRMLEIGASAVVDVDPAVYFVSTGVLVRPGHRVRIAASGLWKDGALPPCDAAGWTRWYAAAFRRFNRVRGADYFVLCASLGHDPRTARAIGLQGEWTIDAAALTPAQREHGVELCLFANDWPSRYGNNHPLPADRGGPLRATVSRLA